MIQATIYKVPSETDRRSTYEVQFYSDGSAKCSCPAWVYSSASPKSCKHIAQLERNGKGFVASPGQTKVFRLKHDTSEIVFVEGADLDDALIQAVSTLGKRKTLTVERIA